MTGTTLENSTSRGGAFGPIDNCQMEGMMRISLRVVELVDGLNRESASGLITRRALIALDRVQRLLEHNQMAAAASLSAADVTDAPSNQEANA